VIHERRRKNSYKIATIRIATLCETLGP
jgi:hypothetical protein